MDDADAYLPSLHKACLEKDVAKVGRLLFDRHAPIDVNEPDHYRRTPLLLAAQTGCDAIVFQLMDYGGVLLNVKDALGNTALLYASRIDAHTILLHLMARGADPNVPDGTGATPLIVASRLGHENVVRVLLCSPKTWIDPVDRYGASALWYAASHGYERLVTMLLKQKAGPNVTDVQRKTPLIAACEHGHTACAERLIQDPRTLLEAVDLDGKTALRYASETDNVDLLRVLLAHKANPNARTTIDKTTALMAASSLGLTRIVETLLAHPDLLLELPDYGDRTALYYACNHPDIATLLVKAGADVKHVDRQGKTVVMRAAQMGSEVLLTTFLKFDKRVNRIDHDGHTALAYAAMGGHAGCVARLLDEYADPSIADDDDVTPLMLAVKHGHLDVVDVLVATTTIPTVDFRDYQGRTALAYACIRGRVDMVLYLIKNHASAFIADQQKTTPLMLACIHNRPEVVAVLLSSQSQDVHAVDKTGHTALYYAAREDAVECVRLLVDHRARCRTANGSGVTPLMVACITGSLDVVKLLLPGSDLEQVDKVGRTALYYACEAAHIDVAAHLIACGEAACTKACVYGKSPLMLAAASDNVEIMDLLLRTPAKHRLDDKDVEGCTALYYAAEQGLVAATKRLVAEGASVHTQCDRGNTACVAAAERGFLDVVRLVLSPLPNHTGRTPLHQASCFGYVHVVQFLLSTRDVDVDVDAVDNQGNSPLILAAMRKHEDVVALLLASKTARTVNACNLASKTALFYAIYNHLVDMVQLLHKHGADVGVLVQHQTLWGTGYPQYCTHDMIRVLVDDLKVDVDCTNRDGKTALFCLALAFGNKWRSIKFLLSRGANPWIMGPGGILPATGAANARVRLLLENAMQEHERFFLVEKARRLCHVSRSPPRHATKRPKPDVRVSWTAADDDTMQGVLDHVVRDLNDDVFRELFAYTKVAWE